MAFAECRNSPKPVKTRQNLIYEEIISFNVSVNRKK